MDQIFQSSGACFPYRLHLQSSIVKKMLHETSQILPNGFSAIQADSTDLFCRPLDGGGCVAVGTRKKCSGGVTWTAKSQETLQGTVSMENRQAGGAERSLQSQEGLPETVSFPHRQPANRARWRNRDIFQRLRLCSLVAIIVVFR